MDMNEFAEVIKKSGILGKNKKKIIYQLLQALGAKDAVSQPSKEVSGGTSERSPSDSTIQKWLSNKNNKPRCISYFPQLKVEKAGKSVHKFLREYLEGDRWIQLRDLFKEWHNNHQNADAEFYINIETDDFITFSTSFWKQFVSFFESLRLWDDEEEPHPETVENPGKFKGCISDEILDVFKEKFAQYKIYEFIPKDIEMITQSLSIYRQILNEDIKLTAYVNAASECDDTQKFKRMYCKCSLDYKYFLFYAAAQHNVFWEMKMPEGCVLLKFPRSFDYNITPANTGNTEIFKYAFVNPKIPINAQIDDSTLQWKECQGKIIIAEVDIPADGDFSIIEDFHVLIDEMLLQDSLVEQFTTDIDEKIIEKYESITFDDNSRLIYAIKQYKKILKKFKEYLIRFKNLQKEKDEYLNCQALIKQFGIYTSFSDFESPPKPSFPFSECYLHPEEACEVKSKLYHCHKSLMELYAEIFSYGENHVI